MQVPNPPGSGKDIAEGKGVHREVESEGSRMWEQTNHGQISGLTSKPNNYTESCRIDVADRWRERSVWYPGRSARHASKEVTTAKSSAERTEVSRGHSSRKVKD